MTVMTGRIAIVALLSVAVLACVKARRAKDAQGDDGKLSFKADAPVGMVTPGRSPLGLRSRIWALGAT